MVDIKIYIFDRNVDLVWCIWERILRFRSTFVLLTWPSLGRCWDQNSTRWVHKLFVDNNVYVEWKLFMDDNDLWWVIIAYGQWSFMFQFLLICVCVCVCVCVSPFCVGNDTAGWYWVLQYLYMLPKRVHFHPCSRLRSADMPNCSNITKLGPGLQNRLSGWLAHSRCWASSMLS